MTGNYTRLETRDPYSQPELSFLYMNVRMWIWQSVADPAGRSQPEVIGAGQSVFHREATGAVCFDEL